MFIRFISPIMDDCSEVSAGIFSIVSSVMREGLLLSYDRISLEAYLDWFNRNLTVPVSLGNSWRRRSYHRAVFWFKDSATEHIRVMREMANVFVRNDVPILVLKSPQAGYIVYEDKHQVAAEPFASIRQLVRQH